MKNRGTFIGKAVVLLILFGSVFSVQSQQKKETPQSDYFVAAYVWPSCHDDPLGREKLWLEGIGEWK